MPEIWNWNRPNFLTLCHLKKPWVDSLYPSYNNQLLPKERESASSKHYFMLSLLREMTHKYYQYCNFDTWIRSHLRAKLCEWAVGSAMAGWYSWAKVLKWFKDPVYQRPILFLTEKGVNISIWSCCCCDAINFFPSLHPFCHEMNITVSPKLTMS